MDCPHKHAALHEAVEWFQPQAGEPRGAVALNYFVYNFIRIHRTLRVKPAMAAGVTDRLFEVSDIVRLLEESESKKAA